MIPSPAERLTTQVIGGALAAAAEQMGVALIRTAYSPNINERADCSTAIFDARGNVVAQAPRIPLHLGSMLGLVGETLARQREMRPGDMFVANDPYAGGGTHLPDITVVAPVFWHSELVAFVANIAHHADVGGMVPGSETPLAEEIYQEGLRLAPIRIVDRGEPVTDVIQLIALNSRTPAERIGDLWAQLSANRVGEREVLELFRRYGAPRMARATAELLEHAEKRFAARLRELAAGEYEAVQHLDNDGRGDEPVRIAVRVAVAEGQLSIDFSGTDAQLSTSRNVPPGATLAVVYCVLKSFLDPELPPNSGYFRSVPVHLPDGSLLNPRPPAAIGQRAYTCQIVADALVLALNQALPGRALAGSGPFLGATFSGVDGRTGRTWLDHETWAGALGAQRTRDGMDAVRVHHSNAANLPVECLEAAYPLAVEAYELVADSAGDGQFRGGLGTRRAYRALAPGIRATLFGERRRHGAPGIDGGRDGRPGRFVHRRGGSSRDLSTAELLDLRLEENDVVLVETPGGGGYGDPSLRAASAVDDDVADGRITVERARHVYRRT